MSFWWVNHKQTFKSEFNGGYIWSPIKNRNGSFNQGYKNLTLAKVGDVVFSYSDTKIKAIGIVKAPFREEIVPLDFGSTGDQWDKDGYLVQIEWNPLESVFKPKDHIDQIKDLLPTKYSPIGKTGNGNQGIYLAKIHETLGNKLLELISAKNNLNLIDVEDSSEILEEEIEQKIIEESSLSPTDKLQLIKSRLGQGKFKNNVSKIEKCCRVTKISNIQFLIASHIKPWRKSTNFEKLDGNNGFLLSPHIDKLFDKGWISFSDEGEILFAKDIPKEITKNWDITAQNIGPFNKKQIVYLDYHRKNVFRDNRNSNTKAGMSS